MRLRNIPEAKETIENSIYVIQNPEKQKGKWKEVFENENPICIEIGTGKCRFIIEIAKNNPDINYIGIEKYSSVLIKGVKEQETRKYPNLYFIRADAELITEFFGKGEISRIYLNFSDPWPKKRNAKRRLTSKEYLRRYDKILNEEGKVEFKTDNRELFDFAIEEIEYSEFKIEQITYDLHEDPIMNINNIMTEYEIKYSSKGNKIYKYILKK